MGAPDSQTSNPSKPLHWDGLGTNPKEWVWHKQIWIWVVWDHPYKATTPSLQDHHYSNKMTVMVGHGGWWWWVIVSLDGRGGMVGQGQVTTPPKGQKKIVSLEFFFRLMPRNQRGKPTIFVQGCLTPPPKKNFLLQTQRHYRFWLVSWGKIKMGRRETPPGWFWWDLVHLP